MTVRNSWWGHYAPLLVIRFMDAVVATIICFHQGGTPMNRRTKYSVGIVLVVLALLAPLTLQAQDELSLDDIVNMVKEVETRLAKIESLLADPWSPDVIYKDDGICQSPLHTAYDDPYGRGIQMMNDRIHQETADAYRSTFGQSIDPMDVDLVSIAFGVGSSNVFLEYDLDGQKVVEKWSHCKYLGHSAWSTR